MRPPSIPFPAILRVAGLLPLAVRLLGGETAEGVEVAAAVPVKAASLDGQSPEGAGREIASLHAARGGQSTILPGPSAGHSTTPSTGPDSTPSGSGEGSSFSLSDRPDLRRIDPPLDDFPWIQALELERPDSFGAEVPEASPFEFSPWYVFHLKLDKWQALANRPDSSFDMSLFHVPPPRETEISKKVRKLVMSKIYREIRSKVRGEWKSQFRDSPSITYADFERRLIQINNIGKDPKDVDQFNVEYTLNEVKQDFFRQEYADGESDIPLVTWGPFTLTDRGSMRFDLGTATHAEPQDVSIDLGNERRKPLIGTEDYRVDTSFILNVNPFRAYTEGDAMYMIRRYGVNVEIDMLSDVLKREMVSAEFEFEADLQGEYAVFANFVIKSR